MINVTNSSTHSFRLCFLVFLSVLLSIETILVSAHIVTMKSEAPKFYIISIVTHQPVGDNSKASKRGRLTLVRDAKTDKLETMRLDETSVVATRNTWT